MAALYFKATIFVVAKIIQVAITDMSQNFTDNRIFSLTCKSSENFQWVVPPILIQELRLPSFVTLQITRLQIILHSATE